MFEYMKIIFLCNFLRDLIYIIEMFNDILLLEDIDIYYFNCMGNVSI